MLPSKSYASRMLVLSSIVITNLVVLFSVVRERDDTNVDDKNIAGTHFMRYPILLS